MQGPEFIATAYRRLGGTGLGERLRMADGDEGIERGLRRIDTREGLLHEFHRRHLAAPDGAGQVGHGSGGEIGDHRSGAGKGLRTMLARNAAGRSKYLGRDP